jgi:hypothetical protein
MPAALVLFKQPLTSVKSRGSWARDAYCRRRRRHARFIACRDSIAGMS